MGGGGRLEQTETIREDNISTARIFVQGGNPQRPTGAASGFYHDRSSGVVPGRAIDGMRASPNA